MGSNKNKNKENYNYNRTYLSHGVNSKVFRGEKQGQNICCEKNQRKIPPYPLKAQ
jgi:hypothetical protein